MGVHGWQNIECKERRSILCEQSVDGSSGGSSGSGGSGNLLHVKIAVVLA